MDVRYVEWMANIKQIKYLKATIKKFKIRYLILEKDRILDKFLMYEKWKIEGDIVEIEKFLNYLRNNTYSIIKNK